MLEKFVHKNFGQNAIEMIGTVNEILDDYSSQGYDLSLRQLYYQLVSRNIVENTEKSYKNIGCLVSDARLAGLVDWDMIKDRGRETVQNPHWEDPNDFVESVAPQYRFDLWKDQDNYIEVMVEKQALEGVIQPVCRNFDVSFTANKGYSSSSAMYEASRRFINAAQSGKELHIIYLGDHDPSGIDMSRDIEDRMNMFIGDKFDPITVHRIALNIDQVRSLNPPENPAKITDSRASEYIKKFGRSSWELDAIEPNRLAELVSESIFKLMDEDLFEENKERQNRDRNALLKFARTYESE